MSLLPSPPAARTLGSTALSVSPIAWGMWRLAEDGRTAAEAARLVHAALDAGITLLDTADIYGRGGPKKFLGDAIARQRDEVFLVSMALPSNTFRNGVVRLAKQASSTYPQTAFTSICCAGAAVCSWRKALPCSMNCFSLARSATGFQQL